MVRSLVMVVLLALGWSVSANDLAQLPLTLQDGTAVWLGSSERVLPDIKVTVTAHGETHEYAGFDLLAALRDAGMQPAGPLSGASLGLIVVAQAEDGYRATFTLAELDPSIGNRQVLLVHSMDGEALSEKSGPWRLVVPADQRPTRWVWKLKRISIHDLNR